MIPMRIWSFLPWFPSNNFCRTGHEIEKKFAELKFMPIFAIPIGNTIDSSYLFCGNSSVGRAQPCQGWGREFESRFPLQFQPHFGSSLVFRSSFSLTSVGLFSYISVGYAASAWLCCRSGLFLTLQRNFEKLGEKRVISGVYLPQHLPLSA